MPADVQARQVHTLALASASFGPGRTGHLAAEAVWAVSPTSIPGTATPQTDPVQAVPAAEPCPRASFVDTRGELTDADTVASEPVDRPGP